jgi:hypothetical protein
MRYGPIASGMLLFAASCSPASPRSSPGSTKAPPAYHLPQRPVRDGETPLPYRPVTDGRITFAAIGLRTRMGFVVGSHADWPARGQFVRVRLLIENGYPTFHDVDLTKQLLVTADGVTHTVDENGMRIERQPSTIEIGAHDRAELDLLYDVPKPARVASLRLFGAPADDLGIPAGSDPGVAAPLG